jgi:hypothetical protein
MVILLMTLLPTVNLTTELEKKLVTGVTGGFRRREGGIAIEKWVKT